MRWRRQHRMRPRASQLARPRLLDLYSRRGSLIDDSLSFPSPETRAELQFIFENAFVGICYLRERVIMRCNRRFEETFGYGHGELNGKSIRVIYPTDQAYELHGRLGYGHLEHHETYYDERLMQRKNGELFWCSALGRRIGRAHRYRSGVWIFQDISEWKSAEERLNRDRERLEQLVSARTADLSHAMEELQASQKKYRTLFQMFPIGISLTDANGKIIEINKTLRRMISLDRIADLTRDGFLSVPNAVLVHPNGSPMAPGDFPAARAMAEKRIIADVEFGVRYDGSETRWFRVSAAPLPIPGYGAMVAYTETTEQKHMEERERQHEMELARVSRLNTLGEMAAALAHELGQPLSSTLNYLHGCQLRHRQGNFDSILFNSAISQAIHHTERAGDIVRNVKQFVRRHEAASTPTQINALIEQTLSVLEFDILESRATLRLELDEDLPTTYLSPLEIQQVLINLIKNAFEAMADLPPNRRRVEVRTQTTDTMVRISVADRGPGIADKDISAIFNPFFTTKPHGMGLGLAVCRSIVESHGGRMSATQNEHGGATFSFTLPIKAGFVKTASA